MKTFKKYKATFIILLTVLSVSFSNCQEKNDGEVEKKLAKKIAEHIIGKDSLDLSRYTHHKFLHISSKKLNENTFKSYVSLNGLRTKSTEFHTEELTIKGHKTIIYYSKQNEKHNLADPFFVPDSRSWRFLSEVYDDYIMLNEIKRIYSDEKLDNEIPDELDF